MVVYDKQGSSLLKAFEKREVKRNKSHKSAKKEASKMTAKTDVSFRNLLKKHGW
jgi:polyamine oxidase